MSNERTAVMTGRQQGMVAAHQPGQDVFKSVLPEDIHWKPFAAFPPSVRLAVIVGQPSEVDPYTIRVRVPHGVKLMPHRHPEDRVYTVISVSYTHLDVYKRQPYASEGEGLHLPPVPKALNRCVLRNQVPGAAPPSDTIKQAAPTFQMCIRDRPYHQSQAVPAAALPLSKR